MKWPVYSVILCQVLHLSYLMYTENYPVYYRVYCILSSVQPLHDLILSFTCILLRADIGGTLLVETELIPVFESMLQVRNSHLLSSKYCGESYHAPHVMRLKTTILRLLSEYSLIF